MAEGVREQGPKSLIKICQKHKIEKKIFELQETQTVKNLLYAWVLVAERR